MAFDLLSLRDAVARHGRVARVMVLTVKGSAPREAGTSMLVWADGQSGTIGGGALEYQAVTAARAMLGRDGDWQRSETAVPLGPALGQCCGGAVTLLSEVYGAAELTDLEPLSGEGRFARPLGPGRPDAGQMPLPLTRAKGPVRVAAGWISEDIARARPAVWIWGAGHVGRALAGVLATGDYAVTLVDTAADRFPGNLPDGITPLIAADPETAVRFAPAEARHYVMTHSHRLDLDLCHALLKHGFAAAGLIGSATKWARFRNRLGALGHAPTEIARIDCPIGLPELGRSPHAIAVGIAARLLNTSEAATSVTRLHKDLAS
jgi:xanthine dehydrogenase accessory factor